MVDVVPLIPDDWRRWRRCRLAALAEAPEAFGSTLAEWSGPGDTEQRWRARLAAVDHNVLLVLDDEVAGMVSATPAIIRGALTDSVASRTVVELLSLWVAPHARGLGVGDAAVRHVVAWATIHHPGLPVELSVKATNERAMRLYHRRGFRDVGPDPDDHTERRFRSTEPPGDDHGDPTGGGELALNGPTDLHARSGDGSGDRSRRPEPTTALRWGTRSRHGRGRRLRRRRTAAGTARR